MILILLAVPVVMVVGLYEAKEINHRLRHPGKRCVVTICFVDSKTGLALGSLLNYSEKTDDSSNDDVALDGDLAALRVAWTDKDDLTIRLAVEATSRRRLPWIRVRHLG